MMSLNNLKGVNVIAINVVSKKKLNVKPCIVVKIFILFTQRYYNIYLIFKQIYLLRCVLCGTKFCFSTGHIYVQKNSATHLIITRPITTCTCYI